MTRFERTQTIEHEIGPTGELRLRTVDGDVRLHGVDGTAARVVATYHARGGDEEAAERAIDAAQVLVDKSVGRLEVDTHERRWSPFDVLGQLLAGTRVRVDFDVDVPRDAAVHVEGVSARVSGEGLHGPQRFRTVSGDLRAVDAAGSIDADAVSGRIEVFGPSTIGIRAHSVSGRIQVASRDLARVQLGTTSGGVDLGGTLRPGVDHAISSVSGGVRLATDGGVTVDLRTLSGSIRSQVPHQVEGSNGNRRVVVGDGGARLRIQAVSAGLEIMRQGAGTAPEADAAATMPSGASPSPDAGGRWAPAGDSTTGERRDGDSPPSESAPGTDGELETLRALERGEIGVEEAASRLSGLRSHAASR